MDLDEVWQAIDRERTGLADLIETFGPADWETASLCRGWTVRDVAAHLTLAHTGPLSAVVSLVRARGSLDRMIHDTAVRQARRPVEDYPGLLRAMVGSRRKVPGVAATDPLMDALVHGQDMVVPLGRRREMPVEAATVATQRAWSMGMPFHAGKRLAGFTLRATDAEWEVGEGPVVEGPIRAQLLLVTGRDAALPELAGPGVPALTERLSGASLS